MQNLSDYAPTDKMLAALEAGFNDRSLVATGYKFGNYLETRQLTKDNYCTVLKTLLNIEDLAILKSYAQLYQPGLKIENSLEGDFQVNLNNTKLNPQNVLTPNIDEVVFLETALPNMNSILRYLTTSDVGSVIFAKVTKVTRNCITFQFKEDIDEDEELEMRNLILRKKRDFEVNSTFLNKFHNVIFRSPRIPFRLMYQALEAVEKSTAFLNYLFPTQLMNHSLPSNFLDSHRLFNKSIGNNAEQLQAVRQIVYGSNSEAPFIVFGPPGTGKTTTIVEAILQLYIQPNSRILVAAGSNSACDTVALRICEYFESHELLEESYENSKTKLFRLYALSYKLNTVPHELKNRFKCTKAGYSEKSKITVATLCTVARITERSGSFTHIFIDEAAASVEPEALMCIVGNKRSTTHVILSGDHKQLGAVIKNNRAADLGLGQSLMERLMLNKLYEVDKSGNYNHNLQARLRRNYRSHPAIVGIYNKLYYNDELIPLAPLAQVSKAENWSKLPNQKFPVLFQAINGFTEREKNSTSSFNNKEAEVVYWYVKNLLESSLNLDSKDIGIVTPYLGQCKLLNQMFRKSYLRNIEVGSVESYQGREKGVIIVSLVASNKDTRFLTNPRRVNVFLSRPKWLLVLIGNPITLSGNKDFKFIIDQCKLQGNYLNEDDKMKSTSSLMSNMRLY